MTILSTLVSRLPGPMGPSPRQVATAIRSGQLPLDEELDCFLPLELRMVSSLYWTPLAVAARVSRWLGQFRIGTVLDIGSGAGKFCVAAALSGPGRFIGLEQRPRLVDAARELAQRFEVEDRVTFVEGSLDDGLPHEADAYYLYNPFGENLYGPLGRLDEDVELSHARFRRDVTAVEDLLERARVGTFLITYNGFGGHAPSSFRELRVDRNSTADLCLLKKIHP